MAPNTVGFSNKESDMAKAYLNGGKTTHMMETGMREQNLVREP